jgi:uncharacterized coiled-coil protein SlyX
VTLEARVSLVETTVKDLRSAVDGLTKQVVALQAHLDHLSARLTVV